MRLALLVVVVLFQNQPHAPSEQQKAQHPKASISSSEQVAGGREAAGHSDKETPTHQSEQGKPYDPYSDRLYRRYLCMTIIGVVGGFIGIGVLVYQAVLTRQSANAARDAANAALNNAQAVIESERAWVDADIVFSGQVPGRYDFRVKNIGRSPAFIMRRSLGRSYWTEGTPIDIPPEFEGQHVEALPLNAILEPAKGIYDPIRGFIRDYIVLIPFATSAYPPGAADQIVTYHGHVVYRDIFQKEHRTEVVYRYNPSSQRLEYLPEYTRRT